MGLDRRWWNGPGACLALVAVVLAACAPTLRVRTDYDREASFDQLKVYSWIDSAIPGRDTTASPFLERRIRRAVDQTLAELGFEATVFGDPDFRVTAFVIGPAEEDTRWRSWLAAPCGPVVTFGIGIGYAYPYGYPYPYGYGMHHGGWYWPTPYFRQPWGYACSYRVGYGYLWFPVYEEPGDRMAGTLVIDILEPVAKELLWRGSAEGAVHLSAGQSPSQEEVDDIVARILVKFPPKPKQ